MFQLSHTTSGETGLASSSLSASGRSSTVLTAPRIMPAATVRFVCGSIRMNEPVSRFSSYRSKKIGCAVVRRTRPMSLDSKVFASSLCSVSTSIRYTIWLTNAFVSRVV